MDPYFLQELSRFRRQEIDEEFKRIHIYPIMKANQPNLIDRVLKRFCSLLAATRQIEKNQSVKPKKHMHNVSVL